MPSWLLWQNSKLRVVTQVTPHARWAQYLERIARERSTSIGERPVVSVFPVFLEPFWLFLTSLFSLNSPFLCPQFFSMACIALMLPFCAVKVCFFANLPYLWQAWEVHKASFGRLSGLSTTFTKDFKCLCIFPGLSQSFVSLYSFCFWRFD